MGLDVVAFEPQEPHHAVADHRVARAAYVGAGVWIDARMFDERALARAARVRSVALALAQDARGNSAAEGISIEFEVDVGPGKRHANDFRAERNAVLNLRRKLGRRYPKFLRGIERAQCHIAHLHFRGGREHDIGGSQLGKRGEYRRRERVVCLH